MTPCSQCGDTNDMMVAFTAHKVCGKCTRRNHRKATGTTTRTTTHARRRAKRHTRGLDNSTTTSDKLGAGGKNDND